MSGIQVSEVLQSLKQASREIKYGGKADQGGQDPPLSTKQLLLQIAALHKGLMALSEAFLESIEATRQQSAAWDSGLDGLRQELLPKLELAQALHEDLQQLVTLEAGLQTQAGLLAERVGALEEQAGSLHLRLEQQHFEVAQSIRNDVTQAANTHFEEHLHHLEQERLQPLIEAALRRQVQQWVSNELEALVREEMRRQADAAVKAVLQQELQAMQAGLEAAHEACSGAAEVAAQAAADMAALAGDVRHLTDWCQRVDAAHTNHEDRLCLLEEAASAATPEATSSPQRVAPGVEQQHQQLAGAVLELDERLERLEAAAQQGAAAAAGVTRSLVGASSWGRAHAGGGPASAGAADEGASGSGIGTWATHVELDAVVLQLVEVQRLVEGAVGPGGQLPALRGQLQELVAQQAQQRKSGEDMMHAVLTDVMALARHTRALDSEVRALRAGVGKAQDALLAASGTFAKALGIPSPVGPFTSFS